MRLRAKHKKYKTLNIYYSALITAASIFSIGNNFGIRIFSTVIPLSNIVLMFSIILTYFIFHTSEQNLQERAYKMEETSKRLEKLGDDIKILEENQNKISKCRCESFYQEYKSIIECVENYKDIDKYFYELEQLKEDKNIEGNCIIKYREVERKVYEDKIMTLLKNFFSYIIPFIIILMLIIRIVMISIYIKISI